MENWNFLSSKSESGSHRERLVECEAKCRQLNQALQQVYDAWERSRLREAEESIYLILDLTGNVLTLGGAGEQIWGYSREELLGASLLQWLNEEDRGSFETMLDDFRHQSRSQGHWQGKVRHGDATISPIRAIARKIPLNHTLDRAGSEAIACWLLPTHPPPPNCPTLSKTISMDLHELILSNITEPVFICDHSGAFTYICPNLTHLFGYSLAEIRQLANVSQLLGPGFLQYLKDCHFYDRPVGAELHNLEWEIRDRDNRHHHILITVKRVAIDGGTLLYTCREITEYKRIQTELNQYQQHLEQRVSERTAQNTALIDSLQVANQRLKTEIIRRRQVEKALRDSERRLSSIAANLPGIVFRYIVHADGTHSLPYISAGVCEFIGVTAAEIGDNPDLFLESVHRDDLPSLLDTLDHCCQTLTPLDREWRMVSRDGTEKWVRGIARVYREDNGDVVFDGADLDISATKATERALSASEAKQRALLAAIPDMLFHVDLDGNFLDFIPGREVNPLVPPEEFLGRNIHEVLPEGFANRIEEHLQRCWQTQTVQWFETDLWQDGRIRHYEVRVTPVENEQLLTMVRDVSNRKQAELALRQQMQWSHLLLHSTLDGFLAIAPNGQIREVNPAFCAMTGYERSQLLHMSLWDLDTNARNSDGMTYLEGASQFNSVRCETQYRHANGSDIAVEASISFVELAEEQLFFLFVRDMTERVRSQVALAHSEARYRAIVEDQTELITRFTPNLTLTFVNEACCRYFGCTKKDMLGKSFIPLITPEDRQAVLEALRSLSPEIPTVTIEQRLIVGEGEIRWMQWNNRAFFDENGQVVELQGVGRDITDRVVAEQSLQESQKFIQKIAKTAPAVIYVYDLVEERTIYLNQKLSEILGRPEINKQVLERGWPLQLLHPEDALKYGERLQEWQRVKNTEVLEWEVRMQHADGRWRTLRSHDTVFSRNPDGTPRQILGMAIDITESKQARRERDRLFEISLDLIAIADFEMVFHRVNPAVETILGYTPEEFVAFTGFDLIHPDDLSSTEVELEKLKSGELSVGLENRYLCKDGSYKWLNWTAVPVLEEGLIYTIARDVTERKQVAAERDRFFNLSLDTMVVLGFDTRFRRVNPAVMEVLGYTPDEFLSLSIFDIVHPDDRRATAEQLNRLKQGQRVAGFENRYRDKDGSYRWLSWSAFAIVEEGLIYGVARDTSDRKRVEEQLRESQEKYRVLFEIFPIGLAICDPNGQIVGANPAMTQILGIDEQASLQRAIDDYHWQMIRPDGTPMPPAEFASVRALNEGRLVANVEMGLIRPDGEIAWLNVTAAPIPLEKYGVAIAFTDIGDRKRAMQELQRREQEYRTLADNTPDIIARIDRQLRHVYVNPAITKATGLPVSHFIGKSNRDLGMPEDLCQVWDRTMYEVFETGEERTIEYEFPTPEGKRVYQSHLVPEFSPDGALDYILGLARDITSLTQANQSLQVARARLEHLLTASPAMIYSYKASAPYQIGFVSPNIQTYLGYEVEEIVQSSNFWHDRVHPDDRDCIEGLLPHLFEVGSHIHEYRFQHKDGSYRWLYDRLQLVCDDEGHPLEIIGSWIDITDRKQAEERAIFLSKAIETSSDAVGMCNPQGVALYHNSTFINLFGYTVEQLAEAGGPRSIYSDREVAREVFETIRGGDNWRGEVQMHDRHGHLLDILLRAYPIKNEAGAIVGLVGVHTDIGDRKRIQEELAHHAAELARSNAELEQFAYIASHDLQEPLRIVSSYTKLLAKRYGDRLDAKAEKYINYITDGSARMQQLIEDLLDYSRVGTRGQEFEPIESEEILQQAIANLHVSIHKNHAAITHDPLPAIVGDAKQLARLLQNLISNAIKYRGERSPAVHVSARRQDRTWVFSIRDNGIGIDPKHHDRIFTIFQRLHTREEYPGTGIGLAICKKIVERHGGRIWVESEPGEGSIFYFTLPDSPAPT
ncbi:PAS domain S-box protein [Oxynema aestuarii]|uniref:histidine kinase n=1 Tax=Oxynema aestuarii AP17 TaxID=2064643 RepID=A0A6H1TT79_9CYAN|nr:PAS domain S-box protein [Oxynema aestuarii]QIZ69792.1 PAS domain S-box protein [Oxynema aestuarii AP17]